MVRRIKFLVLAVAAILLLQFVDCTSAMTLDQQTMQCCGSMPCDPSNQSHDCCKGMVSAQSPNVLPVPQSTLHAQLIVVADVLAPLQVTPSTQITRFEFAAVEHSPPELYTLHSSLLI